MCGIGGFVSFKAMPSQMELDRMKLLLEHRGPDGHGSYLQENIGLVHTRLSIIDIENGHQPLCSHDGSLVLVSNGEIYNYKELRERLELRGRCFSTRSDCEVILHAYLAYGDDFVDRLSGMFAFALWDGAKRRLILARDRLGIKPLYYTADARRVVFASEMKALLPFLSAGPQVDPQALAESLQNQFSSEERPVIKGIRRVLPGEMIVVDLGSAAITRKRYWSLSIVQTRDLDYEEAAQYFTPLFDDVMVEHMRSDVPYGLFLSGGVDSATILSMLQDLQPRKITTFSVGFSDVDMKSELQKAKRMADLFGTRHVPLRLGKDEVIGRIPHMIWALDEFMWDYACLPTSFLAQAAREHALKVVFTGEGGDEVFAGYGRYRKTWPERIVAMAVLPGSGGFRARGRWRRPWPERVFGPELRQYATAYRKPFVRSWENAPASWDYVKKAQRTDMETELVNDLLVKVDRMLMAFGVEGRVPFLDHRVVKFGLSLPSSLKIRTHHGKVFLKRWAERYIPKDHLWGKKQGFSVPIGQWLTGDFLTSLETRLGRNEAVRTWFDGKGLQEMFASHKAGVDASREIWGVMHFAIWHRLFIESPGTKPSIREDPLDIIAC